ncbi:hypothetical protein BDW74DRAFT_153525 [Aspergillus multicolor]|uniref:uncharacterized protein n=1 Tax=Aspergillus multicolor TaxID=41759 RepID=UPI003CCCBFDD
MALGSRVGIVAEGFASACPCACVSRRICRAASELAMTIVKPRPLLNGTNCTNSSTWPTFSQPASRYSVSCTPWPAIRCARLVQVATQSAFPG